MKGERMMNKLVKQSQEAFVLSLELFNRFNNDYRLEGFSFFIINAWELLLKAQLIKINQDDKAIYRNKNPKKNSLSMSDCLDTIFTESTSPVRCNLLKIKEIRNFATHLIVPEIEGLYIGLFQACILNYINYLNKWFDISMDEKLSPGMLAITSGNSEIDFIKLRRKYNKDIINFVQQAKQKIEHDTFSEINNLEGEYYTIPIEYTLAYVKNPKLADIVVVFDNNSKNKVAEIHVPKDIDRTHPYRMTDVVNKVKNEIGDDIRFNKHDVMSIIYVEKIKDNNNKYHYYIKNLNVHLYSDEFVSLIIKNIKNNANYLTKCRYKYQHKK